jgi:hypothetical protein
VGRRRRHHRALVKKTLFVGVFAYIIGNWNNLARIVFESFAGLGLKASGTGFTTADLLRPGKVAQTGLDAARPLLDSISDLMGWVSFFENFIQIACLMFAWALVLLAFFILAIQLFITLIEFKLTTLAGFVLIPFGLFGKSAFMAERVLGNVISSGIKVLVLAVIIGIGSTLFSEFTQGSAARRPRSTTPWRSCSPRCRCWAWASSAPASPTASSPAARSLAPARRSARVSPQAAWSQRVPPPLARSRPAVLPLPEGRCRRPRRGCARGWGVHRLQPRRGRPVRRIRRRFRSRQCRLHRRIESRLGRRQPVPSRSRFPEGELRGRWPGCVR